ncbi:MAG: hypothetical protein HYT83_03915 [Candidatus Levybacteria bacterium]|nr:hypothetical protein [Candidatus Levybacteria bacterium]
MQQLANQNLEDISEEKVSPNGIRWIVDKTKNHPPYVKLVPLLEIVAESLESTVFSQKVKAMYENLCREFGSEITALLKTPIQDIKNFGDAKIAEAIEKVRKGNIAIDPGFDGEYGKVKIWQEEVKSSKLKVQSEDEKKEQLGLF